MPASKSETATSQPAGTREARPRVLYVSSNGIGVGHLMRLMSMARRTQETDAVFLTLSQAVGVVKAQDILVEYLPSKHWLDAPVRAWHEYLRRRVVHLIDTYQIEAVVFDGTSPYRGLLDALDDRPGVRRVWSRRGMWKRGINLPALEESSRFDLILEPGDISESFDNGATTSRRHEVTRIGPVSFLSPHEQLEREQARAELGLDPDKLAVLLQLGAGNNNDIDSPRRILIEALSRRDDVEIVLTKSAIAEEVELAQGKVKHLSVYPLARYMPAFDAAVAASGYNTFHELLATGTPTLFLPNTKTVTDNQARRSEYAVHVGAALSLVEPGPQKLTDTIEELLDPAMRARLSEKALAHSPTNGARQGAEAIEALIASDSSDVPRLVALAEEAGGGQRRVSFAQHLKRTMAELTLSPGLRTCMRRVWGLIPAPIQRAARRRLKRWERAGGSGASRRPREFGPIPLLTGTAGQRPEGLLRVMLTLPEGADDDTVTLLVEKVQKLQERRPNFVPLFVTHSSDTALFREKQYAFEFLPQRTQWDRLCDPDGYDTYCQLRLAEATRAFGIDRCIHLTGLADITERLEPALGAPEQTRQWFKTAPTYSTVD